jgi:type VI secretion system protein ImpG
VELRCASGASLPQLKVDRLRFYMHGESALVHTAYELLCRNLVSVVVRDPTPGSRAAPCTLPPDCLHPVGFEKDEGMLPYTRRSFVGYRLLQEFFTFPEKFFFLDVTNLESIWKSGFKDRVELVFLLSDFGGEVNRDRLAIGLSPDTFRLSCAPIINLFPHTAESILLNQETYEFPIIPDAWRPNETEIFSVDEVFSVSSDGREPVLFEPFYSTHENGTKSAECFWLANRRASNRPNDGGTDMYLSLVDISNRPARPDADTIVVKVTCTNRDLPARLPFGHEAWDFELEGSSPIKSIISLKTPTPSVRPPLGGAALWHLISHLSLNHLSIVEEGKEALKQILKLYNFTETEFSRRMIEGIAALKSRQEVARIVSEAGISFARGWRVELELDEEQFIGGGYYLFASVIERFLSLYTSLNSFSQLALRTRQKKEVIREWPPRAGSKILM